MDVKYINPFIASVRNVFSTMLKMDVQFGRPYVKKDEEHSHDVSAIIGLAGDVIGAVILSFPRLSATRIASVFAGTELNASDDDFADAIGELANMITGNAKKDFDGLNVIISVPSVVLGAGHQIMNTRITPRLVLPCSTHAGSFVVEVGMQQVGTRETELVEASAEQTP